MRSETCLKSIVICAAIVLFSTDYARASLLEVISEQYHVWGNYLYQWDDPDGNYHEVRDSYDIPSSSPVSGSVWYSDRLYGLSSAGLLSVSAGSCSHVDWPTQDHASGNAEGDWIFRPQEGFYVLKIYLGTWPGDEATVLLEDVTVGNQMFYYSRDDLDIWEPFKIFPVDPDHQYHMHAYIQSTANSDGPWSGSIQATVVPEPASALLIGAGFFFTRLRRRQS